MLTHARYEIEVYLVKFLKNKHLYRDLLNSVVKNATMSQEKRSK